MIPRGFFISCFLSAALLQVPAMADLPVRLDGFMDQHCYECHDDILEKGGLNLYELDYDPSSPANLARWAKIHDRVKKGEMPPEEQARPEPDALKAFLGETRSTLEETWRTRYAELGRTAGRRLNPVEYEYTLHDLLAAPWLELKDMLPPDPEAHGFDNVASAQEISYVQLASYLEAAEVAIDGAMQLRPPMEPVKVRTWFSEEGRYLGKDWKERYGTAENRPKWVVFKGQPNSAQAPRRIRNTSPQIPGWYRFRVRCRSMYSDKGELHPPKQGHVAWINTAAKRVLGKFNVPGDENGGIMEFTAWQHQDELLEFFSATLDDRTIRDPDNYQGDGIAVDWIEIEGPFPSEECEPGKAASNWPPESYRRLFGDLPTQPWTEESGLKPPQPLNRPDLTANKRGLRETYQLPPEMLMVVSENPEADAERLLRRFMARAYRRPPPESEVQRCLAFALEAIAEKACFQDAMRVAYKSVLCSPDFLYLQEPIGPLDSHAVASRLSYLLWRSTPDAELLEAAANGDLMTEAGLNQQFQRLLKDDRAQRFFADFTGQWLDLREVHETSPDRYLFPEYFCDNHLVDSAVAETEATFAQMILEDLPARTVVDSDFVMINERLAELYDLGGVHGMEMRRVALPENSPRGGFLTQSSVLKVTANGLTSSPVIRGTWVLERILGIHPSAPPPDAGAIEPDTRGANSIRELLAKHSRSESCAGCHALIDPPGFALENFDVMGAWRDHYRSQGEGEDLNLRVALRPVRYKRGLPVDASGVTHEGHAFEDIHDFREYLLTREEQLARNLAERFLTFATGAGVSFLDRQEVERILNQTAEDEYGAQSLLREVVHSPLFHTK